MTIVYAGIGAVWSHSQNQRASDRRRRHPSSYPGATTRQPSSTPTWNVMSAQAVTDLPLSGITMPTSYERTSTPRCCPATGPASAPRTMPTIAALCRLLPPVFCIHSIQRGLRLRHPLTARNRLLGGLLDRRGHLSLNLRERFRLHALFLQMLRIQPDRVALAPCRKKLGRKRFASLALVMRRVTTHAERFRDQHRRPVAATTPLGGDSCGRVGVEHVVAVKTGSPHTIARRQILEIGREVMLLEPSAERDLVVFDAA